MGVFDIQMGVRHRPEVTWCNRRAFVGFMYFIPSLKYRKVYEVEKHGGLIVRSNWSDFAGDYVLTQRLGVLAFLHSYLLHILNG